MRSHGTGAGTEIERKHGKSPYDCDRGIVDRVCYVCACSVVANGIAPHKSRQNYNVPSLHTGRAVMTIVINAITPDFVAEIGDVDLSKPVSAADMDAIKQAFWKYGVVIF